MVVFGTWNKNDGAPVVRTATGSDNSLIGSDNTLIRRERAARGEGMMPGTGGVIQI